MYLYAGCRFAAVSAGGSDYVRVRGGNGDACCGLSAGPAVALAAGGRNRYQRVDAVKPFRAGGVVYRHVGLSQVLGDSYRCLGGTAVWRAGDNAVFSRRCEYCGG